MSNLPPVESLVTKEEVKARLILILQQEYFFNCLRSSHHIFLHHSDVENITDAQLKSFQKDFISEYFLVTKNHYDVKTLMEKYFAVIPLIPITITITTKTKTYGDIDPTLTYSVAPALQSGDVLTGSLTRVVGENVGTFLINSTLANPKYTITLISANLTITQKAVTITANTKTKIYGAIDPALDYTVLPTLSSGDTLTGILSRNVGENVGTFPITSTLTNPNYNITFVSANLTITTKPITITADAKTKIVGAADPALTYVVNPALINGDTLIGTLTRAIGEVAGNYVISSNLVNSNYGITYTPANLVITEA